MKLTPEERKALTFVVGLVLASGAIQMAAPKQKPVVVPAADAVDLKALADASRPDRQKKPARGGRTRKAAAGKAVPAAQKPDEPLQVDPNAASPEELERLPRVGPAMARKIVEFREKNGRFQSPEDLLKIRGIGPTTLALLRPFLVLRP